MPFSDSLTLAQLLTILKEKEYYNYRLGQQTPMDKESWAIWVLEMDRLRVFKTLYGKDWEIEMQHAQDQVRLEHVSNTIEFILRHHK